MIYNAVSHSMTSCCRPVLIMSNGVGIGRAVMLDNGPTIFQGFNIYPGHAVITQIELDSHNAYHRVRVSVLGEDRQMNIYDAVGSSKFRETVRTCRPANAAACTHLHLWLIQ